MSNSAQRVLGVIPARGGSVGVPRKNIKELNGLPLIGWTIDVAHQSKYISKLILSSDDTEIMNVARELGCEVPFVRPKELAGNKSPGVDPVLHALIELPNYDFVVLLQPTSPLRKVEDIDRCIEYCIENPGHSCVSVTEVSKHPNWMFNRDGKSKILTRFLNEKISTSRQELSPLFTPNGAVYVSPVPLLQSEKSFFHDKTLGYMMPNDRSIDIDTELDFKIAETILRNSL